MSATRDPSAVTGTEHFLRPDSTLGQLAQARRIASGWAEVVYERRISPKVAFLTSAFCGIPFVVEANAVLDDERRSLGQSRRIREGAARIRTRGLMLRAAAHIVAVSDGIRDHLIRRYGIEPEKITTVPNGANVNLFQPSDRDDARVRFGLASDAKIVCFVGNLVPWQGVDSLLRACASLRGSIPTIKLLIVGDGPEANRLRALADQLEFRDRVVFTGSVPYADVSAFVCASDVCAAPFIHTRKASPIKVYEYLACARPVVASDVDGIGECLRSWNAGVGVKPENPEALARAVDALLHNPAEARAMGARGREAIVLHRSWETTARAVAGILKRASTTSPPRRSRGAKTGPC
ncbi:MAG TPA: glycosyltransferase family 4 protein [Thermoplasmata archaeon]|nr:glycosyltransferase family 4 protein [Thermoplasmata archaeon]